MDKGFYQTILSVDILDKVLNFSPRAIVKARKENFAMLSILILIEIDVQDNELMVSCV